MKMQDVVSQKMLDKLNGTHSGDFFTELYGAKLTNKLKAMGIEGWIIEYMEQRSGFLDGKGTLVRMGLIATGEHYSKPICAQKVVNISAKLNIGDLLATEMLSLFDLLVEDIKLIEKHGEQGYEMLKKLQQAKV